VTRYHQLLDYRRQVSAMYASVRERGSANLEAFRLFQARRDDLFTLHPQSPLDETQRRGFHGLSYFPYEPRLRFTLELDYGMHHETFEVQLRDDGLMRLGRVAKVHMEIAGQEVALSLFWIHGYGGGFFLPFGDTTNGRSTYGGGRYLLDTIKGADLGGADGKLVLDFNYAYNPSCAYSSRWACPLAPPENRLTVPIAAGEKAFAG
jgi:uncharacterized protein (DUF1684 family)